MTPLDRRTAARTLLFGAFVVAGCFNSGSGASPDDARSYYPVGVAVSPSGAHLFIANSDFDLAYNAGTVTALDMNAIMAKVPACEAEIGNPDQTAFVKDCWGLDQAPYVKASVKIGAFAADILQVKRYPAGSETPVANAGRLLVPVRGDATVTFIDYEEASDGSITLRCAPNATPNALGVTCDPAWRIGDVPGADSREIALEGEPFSIAAPSVWKAGQEPFTDQGVAAVVHQSSGDVSVLIKTQTDHGTGAPDAELVYTLTGLPAGGTSITAFDLTDESTFTPRFLVTNNTQSSVYVLSFFQDQGTADRSALTISDIVGIPTQQLGYDTRDVVVDPPNAGENRPIRVFLTNRAPASLIVGELDTSVRRLHFFDNVPLPVGAARLVRATVPSTDASGNPVTRTRLYAASFDARQIVSYDPDARQIGNVFRVGRGPYAMAFDPVHQVAVVSNFLESTLQIVELDPTKPAFEQIVLTLGTPADPKR